MQIAAEPLERLIVEMMFSAIDDGNLASHARQQLARREAGPDTETIEEDLRALAEDLGEGRISRAEWLAARGPLEARLQAAQAQVEARRDAEVSSELSLDLRSRWESLDVDRQRAILGLVFERIVVQPARQRGGPQPMVEGIGRIDVRRVEPVWRV